MLVQTQMPSSISTVTIGIPHSIRTAPSLDLPRRRGAFGLAGPDKATWEIAQDIAQHSPVTLVRGVLPRSHCDYNRPAPAKGQFRIGEASDWAFDHPAIQPYWSAYHDFIVSSLRTGTELGHRPLLLDLHGFSRAKAPSEFQQYDIILGTGNRTTVFTDVDCHFAQYLRRRGYRVFLPRRKPIRAIPDYLNGRFTVRNVAAILEIDAIQVEISDRFRSAGAREAGQMLTQHLASFINHYSS